jgi:hypothetical protein
VGQAFYGELDMEGDEDALTESVNILGVEPKSHWPVKNSTPSEHRVSG